MSRNIKVFGRMRKDWELMRQVCVAADDFIFIMRKSEDTDLKMKRLNQLRWALDNLRGHESGKFELNDKEDQDPLILRPAPEESEIKMNLSTPDNREFWKFVCDTAEIVRNWPAWKRGGKPSS